MWMRIVVGALAGAIALGAAGAATPASAPSAAGRPADDGPRDLTHYNLPKNRLAIEGYDPVAYFPEGGAGQKPTKGDARLEHTHRGVVYRFSSRANLELFLRNPARYEPAYGGWCAWAMADGGRKVEIDPKAFIVDEDRLFLFYKDWFTDTRDEWKKDPSSNAPKADANWERISGERPRRQESE